MKISAKLSDLFFNYPHPHYEAEYYSHSGNERAALLKDAQEFLDNYIEIFDYAYTLDCEAVDLANDFFSRL